jgi:hypothetical protein
MACQCRARNTEQFCRPPVGSDLLAHKRDFQANSSQAQITDSTSTNAVSFLSARTMKRFPSPRWRQHSRSFARWNQSLRRSPNSNRRCSDCQRLFPNTSRAPKCGERYLESTDKPGHRGFIYPVIAAVTGPVLTFAPPAFFGT